jgi:hypothetical protein
MSWERPARKTPGAIRDDPTLWELLDTPLIFYVVAMTCSGESGRSLPVNGTLGQRRDQLFANYIDTALRRRAVEGRYKPEKTKEMIKRRTAESL